MTEPKPAENGNINAGIAENLQNRPTDGDYFISQRAAIDAVNDVLAEYIPTFKPWQDGIPLRCASKIMALPAVQPERKKGTWIHQVRFGRIECDQCGKVYRNTFSPKNFCPNCGADMRPREEEQDE